MNPIRVLNVLPEKNCKEAEVFAMNIYRNINRENVQFDFLFQGHERSIFEDEIISLGGNIFRIDKLKTVGIYNYKDSIKEFFDYHNEYEIVHCYLDRYSGIVLGEAKKVGVKVRVAHMYNKDIKLNKIGYLKFSVNRNANYKFAYSKDDGENIFGEFEKFTLLRNIMDLDKFSYNEDIRNRLKKDLNIDNEKVIGYISRGDSEKDNKKVISLFNDIKNEYTDSKFVIVLNNYIKDKMEEKKDKYNLKDNIILLNEDEALEKDIMQCFDIMIFTSDLEIDNFLVKAQENNLPCVVLKNMDDVFDLNLGLVFRFNFNENEKIVAENILDKTSLRNSIKQDYIKYKMKKLGYDSREEAKILENFYLRAYKNRDNKEFD